MHLLNSIRNPTLEDQALARIHRMGQKQEVTTVRFCVRDTFEEVIHPTPVCLDIANADIPCAARD
jgi:SNF2 family DNA or RNA helicase